MIFKCYNLWIWQVHANPEESEEYEPLPPEPESLTEPYVEGKTRGHWNKRLSSFQKLIFIRNFKEEMVSCENNVPSFSFTFYWFIIIFQFDISVCWHKHSIVVTHIYTPTPLHNFNEHWFLLFYTTFSVIIFHAICSLSYHFIATVTPLDTDIWIHCDIPYLYIGSRLGFYIEVWDNCPLCYVLYPTQRG